MSATTQINMINLQVFAEQQAALDKQKGTYDANIASDDKYYLWQSSFQTIPMGMEGQPEAYARQLRINLPDVNTIRLPFNAFSFNSDGSLNPQYERFILEAAKQGFQFVFNYSDGDIQRLGGSEQPASADQMRAQLNGAIHDRMMQSWDKMLDWLDDHPQAANAVYALEAVNEPNTYARAEDRTGNKGEFIRLYGNHMAEFAEMVQERSDARIMIGGFAYSAKFDVLANTRTVDGQGSVLEQIRDAAGSALVWSAHLYPDWASGAGQELEGFEALIRQNYGVLSGDDIIITETNATGGPANDASGNDASFWMARAYEAFLDAGIGIGWFPGAETGQSAFLSIDNGWQIRFRHPDSFAHGMNAFTMGQDDPDHAGNEAITARLLAGFVTDEDRGPTGLDGLGYAVGYGGNDTLTGIGNAMNMLFGGDGNDILTGRAERDHLFGQHGDDTLYGGNGKDVLSGGDGDDLLHGGNGNDLLTGGRGADSFVFTDGGEDVVTDYRREQGDTLTLGNRLWTDAELVAAGRMIDSDGDGAVDDLAVTWQQGRVILMNYGILRQNGIVNGTSRNDLIEVGFTDAEGDKLIWTGGLIDAGAGDDTVVGSMSDDTISGGSGNDMLTGRGGRDVIDGGSGNDTIMGDTGNDTLTGGDGNDSIHGGADHDVLYGNLGNDALDGGEGNDQLFGGDGDDTLGGAGGNDTLVGGEGNDMITDARGRNLLSGENGDDTIIGGAEQDTINGGSGKDSLAGNGSDDVINGGADDDWISGGEGNDRLYGDAGFDTLIGGGGNDTMYGGSGADVISAVRGLNVMYGEDGSDSITGGSDADTIDGGSGNDLLSGGPGADVILGGLGHDSLIGGDGNNNLNGGEGQDTLIGNAGNDTLVGGAGNDLIRTGTGVDYVMAGDGDDRIEIDMSGTSSNFLTGGAGADRFVFMNAQSPGVSRASITDFDVSQDILIINGYTGYAAISSTKSFVSLQDVGDDAVLRFGEGIYVFKGLDASDFF